MRFKLILKSVFHYMKHRKFAVAVSVVSIALAFTFLSFTGSVLFAFAHSASDNGIKYPLIIGAEGTSDTQLVMSTVFHLDKPHGLITDDVYKEILADKKHVIDAYPIAVADNYKSIQLIGTNQQFVDWIGKGYVAKDSSVKGDLLSDDDIHRVVVGYEAAERASLAVGDTFSGSHGMVGSAHAHHHANFKYKVAGILAKVNGPEDYAIYSNYKAVWAVHDNMHHEHSEHHDEHAEAKTEPHDETAEHHNEHAEHHAEGEEEHHHEKGMLTSGKLTAIVVRTVNPIATVEMESIYSAREGTTAVNTSKTVRRLIEYMNTAEKAVGIFSYAVLVIVLLMISVTIMMGINERKRDLALMRSLGVGRTAISSMVVIETFIITALGLLLGIVVGPLLLLYFKPALDAAMTVNIEPFIITNIEIMGIIVTLIASQILALIGMIRIYSMNLVEEIAKN